MNISEFFKKDVTDFATYDTFRKIAHCIDGQKFSSRKAIYTFKAKNITNPTKLDPSAKAEIANFTNYIHGAGSLEGVLVNLAQDFPGSNNIPLMKREGNFGSRLVPVASASRYISTCKEDIFDKIFKKEDDPLLKEQWMEGQKIEPECFVPTLPLILINGASGIATGFRQLILQRDPNDIIKIIEKYLKNGDPIPSQIHPGITGFKGSFVDNGNNSHNIYGVLDASQKNTITITELPIGETLESYTKKLDKLVEANNNGIKSYTNQSEGNEFYFDVKVSKDFYERHKDNHSELYDIFKLRKSFTEQLYAISSENTIKEYGNVGQILEEYINVRLQTYESRRKHLLEQYDLDLKYLYSKIYFIKLVLKGEIDLKNESTDSISKKLEQYDEIKPYNKTYDYLLNMAIRNLTTDEVEKLAQKYKDLKTEYEELSKMTKEQLYKKDLEDIKKDSI